MGVQVLIDNAQLCDRILNDSDLWLYAANEWYRLISPWTPMETGMLQEDVTILPGKIKYESSYAKKQYSTPMHHPIDPNPLATDHWDEAAKPSQKNKLADSIQAYIKWRRS